MWRRYPLSLIVVGATFFLLGTSAGEAVAQSGASAYTSFIGQPAGPDDVAALLRRPAVPAKVYGLTGPDTLAVGEEGRFTASANIGAASFPLRFRWDFRDGATASSLHARHSFAAPGTYTVTFRASNAHGEAKDTLFVRVARSELDQPASGPASAGDGTLGRLP